MRLYEFESIETLVPGEIYSIDVADLPAKYKTNYKRGGIGRGKGDPMARSVYRQVQVKYLGPNTDRFYMKVDDADRLVKVELQGRKDKPTFVMHDFNLKKVRV